MSGDPDQVHPPLLHLDEQDIPAVMPTVSTVKKSTVCGS
jgi:hypothetical protein